MTHAITRRATALVFMLALVPAAVPAQDLPPASEIIDRYVEALGGREAVLSQPGSYATGTFSMPAAGLEARMEVYSAQNPDRSITIIDIPGLGTVQEGFTGEYAWGVNPNMGPRLLEGEELVAAKEGASTLGQIRDASMFTERTTVEQTEMNGEACYRVKLVWNSGRESFDCYSLETGLLVAQERVQPTPMGEISVVILMGGYEPFGGVLTPTRITQQMMGQEQSIVVDSVEIREIDPARFDPPASIQSLIEQKESAG